MTPDELADRISWMQRERDARDWSNSDLAKAAQPFADKAGYQVKLSQQHIWNFENKAKKLPGWWSYVEAALKEGAEPDLAGELFSGVDVVNDPASAWRGYSESNVVRTPDPKALKTILPILMRDALGVESGPAIARLSETLADVLMRVGNAPSLLSNKEDLKEAARKAVGT